ncbi:MAG: LytTR family DNA-binding domain-containing protein [Bacteroidota bacterium]
MVEYFKTPFPRPKNNKTNVLWIFLIGVLCSLFIIVFKPFNIKNTTGTLQDYLILFSLGILFSSSIYVWEFVVPRLLPKSFIKWTLGKAISWYSLMMLFVGALMFLYKSYLGGFTDFTFKEYLFVCGRVFLISITVSFFVLGLINYLQKSRISSIAANESCFVKFSNDDVIQLYFNEILYIESDENYVDIHLLKNGERRKEVIRSSLKNIEGQLVYPISPIYRCHRKFLINFKYFEVEDASSRSMTIRLKDGETTIPVSKQYVMQIGQLLINRH